MSKIRITKQFTFETGHALYGYDGKCKNVHGHSYKLSVTVIGTPIDDQANVKYGMVIDFGDLKKIVKEEMVQIKKEVGEQKFEKGNYEQAAKMFEEMSIANQFEDFLTVPAYNEIIRSEAR